MAIPKVITDLAKANQAAKAPTLAPAVKPAAPTSMTGAPPLPRPPGTSLNVQNKTAPTLTPKITPPANAGVSGQINAQMGAVPPSAPAPKLSAGQQSAQNWINNPASGQGGLDAYKTAQQEKIKQAYAMGDQATVDRLNKDMQRVGYSLDTPDFFGAPESVGANFRNDIEAQIAAMQGEQAAAQSLLQYQQGQNNTALQEQLQGLNSAQAVDNQGAQELQNRRGGFYSGGLDYQLGNIGSAYASQRGALTRDVQARNAQLADQYGTQSKTIAANIANLQKNQPQIIQEMIDKWQQTNAGLTGKYYGNDTMALDQQKYSQNFDTNAQTGSYLPPKARELISQVLTYKQQYEQEKDPAKRRLLNQQANAARAELSAMQVDPSAIGANVNSTNARTGAATLGQPTEDARQFNAGMAEESRQFDKNMSYQQARDKILDARDKRDFDENVRRYGLDRALDELIANEQIAQGWDQSEQNWTQIGMDAAGGGSNGQDYNGLTTNQYIDSLRSNYTEVDNSTYPPTSKITTDPERREDMFVDVWNNLPPGASPQQAWSALGLTAEEIKKFQEIYPDTKQNFNSPGLTNTASLGGVFAKSGNAFTGAAQKYGIDPLLLTAIAMHETGNGTSPAVKNKNNPGGLMRSKGGLQEFSSLEEGIDKMASTLKRLYIDQGLTTIEQISKKYAPVGAANDPTNLNKNWVAGVTKFYNQLKGG